MKTKIISKKNNSKIIIPAVISILLLAGLTLVILEKLQITDFIHLTKSGTQVISKPTGSKTNTNSGGTKGNTPTIAPSLDTSVDPAQPTGTFVSNHSPNLSGKPAPNTEASFCQTTPGAKCTIKFTNNGVVKSLPTKTVDSDGNASWDWTLQEVGLSQGQWTVMATASNGDKKTETLDTLLLTVEQ